MANAPKVVSFLFSNRHANNEIQKNMGSINKLKTALAQRSGK
jgi:hypothetical protein